MQHNRDMRIDLFKGALGIGSVTIGSAVSTVQTLEPWLRLVSLIVGILVGLASFWSIVRKWKTK